MMIDCNTIMSVSWSVDCCISYKFSPVEEESSSYHDYQEIRMQEHVQKLGIGYIPRSVWVVLERDLVDSFKAGDDVLVTGIVRQQWKSLNSGSTCLLEVVIHANHIVLKTSSQEKNDITDEMKSFFDAFWCSYKDNPLEGRNVIIASFCPQVFGLYVVKLCICLALVGGVQYVDESGTLVRGDCHLLLVGDPGYGILLLFLWGTYCMLLFIKEEELL
ncbi:PREDICTED: probable DNA helicase MCM9 [Amphimedon queenslandica]|uniref:MCM C-terminal AAA(+) ATPase domain-containing protein n=1 Tax=Amphimedon queenslandica TaxID=400682 RepID=A0A1X7U716_AMPQE|nr:PREDICTED: probable DNA helicase MCM9 [Amphimedon queenslandica]|eukprot:XP_003388796.2 PREDICTED: probable DNA helicase MCM9 [Amphimedon queenslandica]